MKPETLERIHWEHRLNSSVMALYDATAAIPTAEIFQMVGLYASRATALAGGAQLLDVAGKDIEARVCIADSLISCATSVGFMQVACRRLEAKEENA